MLQVLSGSWALFLGLYMLMIGNGLQGTLLGVRGGLEHFSTLDMSIVMSGYFLGFLGGSRLTPEMIRRVGHVRVFAALGSTISAVLIMYPTLVSPWAWTVGRVLMGFCFCGVYITAESWLNSSTTNEIRGKALSFYLIVQMAGIVTAQYILTLGDAGGYVLFIIPSVLVSMAFAPILLSIRPTPAFATSRPLPIRRLIEASPLACVGMLLLGGVFSAQFGMSAVYGTRAGLDISEISVFVSTIYVTALVAQYPIGWLSDRMDRRVLIIALGALGGLGALIAFFGHDNFALILVGAAVMGGTSNPLYGLLIAYANDFLERDDMAAASGGLLFINGLGAVAGPLVLGYLMDHVGNAGYWVFMAALMLGQAGYGGWRMTRRKSHGHGPDTVPFVPIGSGATPVAAEMLQEAVVQSEQNDPPAPAA